MKTMMFVLCALMLCVGARAADAPKVTSVKVFASDTTITGQKIAVPANPNVVVTNVTFEPGAQLPVHKHPFPHYVYVLEGTLSVTNAETGKTTDLPQGSFFVEMTGTWHFGKNNGSQPVKLLSIDQLPQGVTSNVVLSVPVPH
jgi:quercetin dioxygenase-like cupin family protein